MLDFVPIPGQKWDNGDETSLWSESAFQFGAKAHFHFLFENAFSVCAEFWSYARGRTGIIFRDGFTWGGKGREGEGRGGEGRGGIAFARLPHFRPRFGSNPTKFLTNSRRGKIDSATFPSHYRNLPWNQNKTPRKYFVGIYSDSRKTSPYARNISRQNCVGFL